MSLGSCGIANLAILQLGKLSGGGGKGKVQVKGQRIIGEEPVKSMKKKDLVRLDKEIASKLQAELMEERRLTREKDEDNVALTEE
ncbi:hypothetical protein Tco_0047648 [Tanacetum coccineum]